MTSIKITLGHFIFISNGFLSIQCLGVLDFEPRTISGISELGADVIMKEMTSLHGSRMLFSRCAHECKTQDGCSAFITSLNRCILIGDSSVPGRLINTTATCEMDIHIGKDDNIILIILVLSSFLSKNPCIGIWKVHLDSEQHINFLLFYRYL